MEESRNLADFDVQFLIQIYSRSSYRSVPPRSPPFVASMVLQKPKNPTHIQEPFQANLGCKITAMSRNLNTMRRNRAKDVAKRIKGLAPRTNSNSCRPLNIDRQCGFGSGFCSAQALIQNYSNFQESGAPTRFMYYSNGTWFGFSGEIFELLKAGFAACKPMVEVPVDVSQYLFDFIRMLQIDLVTGDGRSISWIDVNGKCFFPKLFVGEETSTVSEVSKSPKVEVQRQPLNSAEEHSDESSSNDHPSILQRTRIPNPVLERTKWRNVKELKDEDKNYAKIKNIFLSGLRRINQDTTVTSIHRCLHMGPLGSARLEAFKRQIELTKAARGKSNVRLAWHGTSAEGVASIITHGFGMPSKFSGSQAYGVGIYLSPPCSSYTSAFVSEVDDNGEKHILLCRVILGNTEKVEAGSHQFHPTSLEFDTGVDDLENPEWYIVWSTHMNRYILPEYVVSYKSSDHQQGLPKGSTISKRAATASRMSFPELFSEIRSSLPPSRIQDLENLYSVYKAGKVAKDVLIRQLRLVAGDKLLVSTIRKSRGSVRLM